MALGHSPPIITDGLVFYYDMGNTQKSWKGEPTTNYAYFQNPRIDASYTPYIATESGTWKARHSTAIRVYNSAGSEITGYVNTGVTDWTNTSHAVWEYDKTLQKPVVIINDLDGIWSAKSYYLGLNFQSLGMIIGSQYTISWLQWVENINKRANVGLYTRNSSGVYNFYDGTSDGSVSSTNTLPYTWQRVYHTFTVSSNWNLSDSYTAVYMYGHYFTRGVLKIADVQFELKDHPTTFSNSNIRSNTQALLDLTNTNTITASSLTYSSDNTFTFSSSDKLDVSLTKTATCSFSIWASTSIAPALQSCMLFNAGPSGSGPDLYFSNNVLSWNIWDGVVNSFGAIPVSSNDGKAHNYTVINDASTGAKLYYDGNLLGTATYRDASSTNILIIGSAGSSYYWAGTIPIVQVYSKALSETEIKQNFNALRGRFGV